jgi:hypothetical protein
MLLTIALVVLAAWGASVLVPHELGTLSTFCCSSD